MRSPRVELRFHHYVDADSLSMRESESDRAIFTRHVAVNSIPSRPFPSATSTLLPSRTTGTSTLQIPSSLHQLPDFINSNTHQHRKCDSPRVAALVRQESPNSTISSNLKKNGRKQYIHLPPRPNSPVGECPADAVLSPLTIHSPRRAFMSFSDMEKISLWLKSLEKERTHFSSYLLYCEMLFHESSVLLQGKPTPNRLQTAIAFHCLCKATSVFHRHEDILLRICRDLGKAIYISHDELPIHEEEMEALEQFTQLTTYYEQHNLLQQQKHDIQQEMKQQAINYEHRLRDEQAKFAQMKDLENRHQIKTLDKTIHRSTAPEELTDKLHTVLQKFQYIKDHDKEHLLLTVMNSLNARVSAETILAIMEKMSPYEKDKLIRQLFQDEIGQITSKMKAEIMAFITDVINGPHTIDSTDSLAATLQPHRDSYRTMFQMDDDLSDQDRKILEAVTDKMEEMEQYKQKNLELQQKLEEAEQLVNTLRWKNNDLVNEANETSQRHEQQLQEIKEEVAKLQPLRVEKETQTNAYDKTARDDDDDDDDDDESTTSGRYSRSGRSRLMKRRGLNEDDDLICKNRQKNKFGFGIASIIDQAKIASSKVRKILSKRKPLTLNELHAIIIGYYQAKMMQDMQDDSTGKPRTNLAQFIMDLYVLHYGLKDLAISQLVFLDAAIRRYASESARVRTFGLLTGSLDPESHACSVQGIDFFLLVVVVIFNAGVYRRGRKQAVAIAQNLKAFFGEGIFMSPRSVTVKSELVCQTIDLVFSFMQTDESGVSSLESLKDDIRTLVTSSIGGIDIDLALEKLMNHWFQVYEQQIQGIHSMFTTVDTNGDGILDFHEFCELVAVLEPTLDRREALALYNRAAGDDHVIDKDEFVELMLEHQRTAVLKEAYGDARKKTMIGIQQRKSTLLTAGAMNTARKTLAELDKDGSYASLTVAMDSSMTELSMNENSELLTAREGNDEGDEEESTSTERVQENVSFMTLSRLSMWAKEAKLKLKFTKVQSAKPRLSLGSIWNQQPSLTTVTEIGDNVNFEQDVDALLRQALLNANINVNECVS